MFNKNSGTGLKILAILSGMAGVGYEVFFFRLLTNYLGDMFYVHATLLSSFLLGIGIGSKKAYRFHGYLHVVEWLIGLYALLFPTILSIAQQQQWLRITLGNPALTSLLTILFLGPPSILIGFSVPLFSAYLKNTQAQKAFASIYTVYNLGAFVSVLLIELFLIRIFGISFSLYCNGTLNIVIGIILFFRYGGIRSVKPQDTEKEILFSRRVILALAVSSFASSIFQMFFYKTCFHIFDTNRENFAIGLAVTFIAISIGTYLVRRYKLSFDTCMLLAIFSLGLIFFLFKEIHRFFMSLWDLARYSHLYRPFFKLALASAYGLPPLAFFGATIPAILRSEKAVAKESGHLLWISCLGNALGYLFYVYYGHVHLSNNGLISAIAGLCFLACLLMHGLDYLKKRALSLTILVLLTTLMAFRWSELNFYLSGYAVPQDYRQVNKQNFSLFKYGPDSVALLGDENNLILTYNGHRSITIYRDREVNYAEVLVGVLPALYVDDYSKALVIGLGSGITAGSTALIYQNTDIVDINKAFIEMQPKIKRANFDITNNSRAHIYCGDGRIFLSGKEKEYNVIISTVSRPDYYSAGKIYTLEFYQQVSQALKDGGVFAMWIDSYMGQRGTIALLGALQKVFKYCSLHRLMGSYSTIICSQQPLKPKYFHEIPAPMALKEMLRESLPFVSLNDYFRYTQLSDNIFKNDLFRNNNLVNTDDFPVLEFDILERPMIGDDKLTINNVPDLLFKNHQALNVKFWFDFVNNKPLTEIQKVHKSSTLYRLYDYWADYFKEYCLPFLEANLKLKAKYFSLATTQLSHYREAERLVMLSRLAYFSLANGYPEKAKDYFEQLLAIEPLSIQAHAGLANIYSSNSELADQNLQLKHQIYLDYIERSPQ